MVQTKNIHIIDLSENLLERLSMIKLSPNYILSKGVNVDLIKKTYPSAKFVKEGRADLILGIIKFSAENDLGELLTLWKKRIKSDGLLLFGLIDVEVDIREVGDFLLWLGFVDVVVDREDDMIFAHAFGPKEMSVKINQIRRAN